MYRTQGNSDMLSTSICGTNYTNVFSTFSRTPPCYNINTYYSLCSEQRTPSRKYREPVIYRRPEKLITKHKRRPAFTTQQILALEKIFNKKPYINKLERQVLMERLNLNERVIKLWFKNRRRMSGLRKETVSESSGEETENNFNLDYVQSKINEPDEFGYVILDERAMSELMTAVVSCLKDVDLDEFCMEFKNNSYYTSNYEPVSPVNINGNADDICFPKLELYEPEESLRRLFDVQALINK